MAQDLLPEFPTGSDPVNLTPFIKKGDISGARTASEVTGIGDRTSYSGFIQVNETVDNNLFFWYFPPMDPSSKCLALWLQGGPGGASTFALFSENGPFSLASPTGPTVPRNTTWNKLCAQIFIDNPVGAGFSYTGTGKGYRTNQPEVAADLLSGMLQFYTVFTETQDWDFYITGESYAGHYIPGFGFAVHNYNTRQVLHPAVPKSVGFRPIPLVGLAIGDGWVGPEWQVPMYPDFFYSTGLVSYAQKAVIQSYVDQIMQYIDSGDTLSAFDVWDRMLNGDVFPYHNLFHNYTGSNDYDNYARTNAPQSFGYFGQYLNQPSIRSLIHVGDLPFNSGHTCELHLLADFMRSLMPETSLLAENYKMLVYSGQFDVIIGAVLTDNMLVNLDWSGRDLYRNASRAVWRVDPSDGDVAGFVQSIRVPGKSFSFTHAIVRTAGHILPHDQPVRAFDMMRRFILDIPYENLPDPTSAGTY
jgi:vitellogenic carboxypeptidase-like protein